MLGVVTAHHPLTSTCTLETAEQIFADNTGQVPVSAQFQRCVRDQGVQDVALPPGTYLVDAPIVVERRAAATLTIRTAGLAGETRNCQQLGMAACAKFLASPSNRRPPAAVDRVVDAVTGRPEAVAEVAVEDEVVGIRRGCCRLSKR